MIGVCGYGYSGSGAFLNLLQEYSNVSVLEEPEFDFVYMPDGLEDLYYHLCLNPVRYLSGNTAIKRYINFVDKCNGPNSGYRIFSKNKFKRLSYEYINSLIQVSWKGIDEYEKINSSFIKRNLNYRAIYKVISRLEHLINQKIELTPYSQMFLSVDPENFIEYSQEYIINLIRSSGVDSKKILVLNQPFPSNNPSQYYKYYIAPNALIIDRDPRDLYILAKKVLLNFGSFIPSRKVEDFIVYYQKTHKYIGNKDDSVVFMNFEDLIYKYDETVEYLESKYNLGDHYKKYNSFDPAISINNTQLFLKYPEYEADIKVIEQRLSDYLFPFEQHGQIPEFNKTSF